MTLSLSSTFHINPVDLSFDLPEDLIAQEPLKERDRARLMVLNREEQSLQHRQFRDLLELLSSGDVLVLNKAKVNRAKLLGKKKTGGRVEILMVAPTAHENIWRCLVRPELKLGAEILLGPGIMATLMERNAVGENILRFDGIEPADLAEKNGMIPLPPYIKRNELDPRSKEDENFYQTVYASEPGSLAAPTAGLHFSDPLLEALKKKGITIFEILLHVGWGTFKPISKSLDEHRMLEESYEIESEIFRKIKACRTEGRRIVGVGTTVTRVLESLSPEDPHPIIKGETNLFIKPGFEFKWLSGLITNLHVPRSTPISLTSAFCGLPLLERAYHNAIQERYRFFSYGDAMLIL